MTEPDTRVNIRGFSKESSDLVREMETFGWMFRPSNHGVVGRAPNDRTTISISRKLRKSNHSYQRAWADFRRWLKVAHPELIDVAERYKDQRIEADEVAETDPIIARILERRAIARSSQELDVLTEPIIASSTQTESEEVPPMTTATITKDDPPTITDEQPLHLKKSKDGILRVQKRTWSDGRVDFHCAYEGCLVSSRNPRSITQHYGAMHTRPVESYTIAAPKPAPESVEPAPATGGLPWEALAEVVEELRETAPTPVAPEPVTKQQIDKQYDVMSGDLNDDHDVITAIRQLVSGPLVERVKILAEQVNVLTKERDEAREALAKIQSDWDALRSLLGNR